MASNFDFLKNIDKKLFSVIDDAEKLYRDGYFEQTIVQVRKFGELVTKNVLGVRRTTEETFDDMLATLKDILGENPSDKEFIDDLYFIKKQGNLMAHESNAEQNKGTIALETLQRAFEVSINYAIKNNKANKKILNSTYSIDLLMNSKKEKLSEKYDEEKEKILKEAKKEPSKEKKNKVVEADFKKKKRIKKEESKPSEKSEPQKKDKPHKKDFISFKADPEKLLYLAIGAVLFVLFISIMLFILPV